MHAQSRCAPENVMHFGVGLEFIRLFLGLYFVMIFFVLFFIPRASQLSGQSRQKRCVQ